MMDVDKYNEMIERGYDPGLLGPPPDESTDHAPDAVAPQSISDSGERKGWIAQNPYRAAFVALAVLVVGGLAGLVMALGGGASEPVPEAAESVAPAGPVEQVAALPTVGEAVPYTKNNPNAYWEVGVDLAPGVYERKDEGWCWWEVHGPAKEVLVKGSTAADNKIALVPEGAAGFLTSGCGTWVRIG